MRHSPANNRPSQSFSPRHAHPPRHDAPLFRFARLGGCGQCFCPFPVPVQHRNRSMGPVQCVLWHVTLHTGVPCQVLVHAVSNHLHGAGWAFNRELRDGVHQRRRCESACVSSTFTPAFPQRPRHRDPEMDLAALRRLGGITESLWKQLAMPTQAPPTVQPIQCSRQVPARLIPSSITGKKQPDRMPHPHNLFCMLEKCS